MTTHTPAPWKVQKPRHFPNRENAHLFIVNGDALVSIMPELQNNRTEESEANARLIAAAPELLEALQTVLKLAEDGVIQRNETNKPSWHLTDELKAIARAAIAKAEGN